MDAGFWRIIAVDGICADDTLRMCLALAQKLADERRVVLKIGVDLQNMAKAALQRKFKPVLHRDALAAVLRAREQQDPLRALKLRQNLFARLVRAVVHDDNGQIVGF